MVNKLKLGSARGEGGLRWVKKLKPSSEFAVRLRLSCDFVLFVCMFVLGLNVPVNNFSVMSGRSCLSSTVGTPVVTVTVTPLGIEPRTSRFGIRRSTNTPSRSLFDFVSFVFYMPLYCTILYAFILYWSSGHLISLLVHIVKNLCGVVCCHFLPFWCLNCKSLPCNI